jgi:hypothetical protein
MAKITYEIDRKDFERFLAENPERVFDQNSITECALAVYLRSVGLPDATVDYTNIRQRNRIDGTKEIFHLPAWAAAVTRMRGPEHADTWQPYPFTARQILDFLATLPEDSHA